MNETKSIKTNRSQVYAVVRLDLDARTSHGAVTVKEVLPTQEEAEREVERLNGLRSDHLTTYFWQATRYFPDGRE
jgi:hypothetical protein